MYKTCNAVFFFLFVSVLDVLSGQLCPPVGLNHKFEVTTIQTATPMYGCAYMENGRLPNPAPLFHLWLERPELTMVHGHCNDMQSTYNESLLL